MQPNRSYGVAMSGNRMSIQFLKRRSIVCFIEARFTSILQRRRAVCIALYQLGNKLSSEREFF